ncbi:hypothetical protein COOONC_09176 [Cooperia oncophora]
MYRVLFKPVVDYLYQRYKIIETAILIYFLGPVCDTIVKNIPEKSPFCDDSDVELEGMLPDEITDEIEEMAVAGETEGEDSLGDIEPPSPLEGIPQRIHASESSDEEFDLKLRKPAPTRRKRQKGEGPTNNGAAPEVPTEAELIPAPPRRRRNGRPDSFDDEFELLQMTS